VASSKLPKRLRSTVEIRGVHGAERQRAIRADERLAHAARQDLVLSRHTADNIVASVAAAGAGAAPFVIHCG